MARAFIPLMFTIQDIRFHVLPMRTRFPFKYGIASMSALPHLFVSVFLKTDRGEVRGLASEGLPPKWFTKDPDTPFESDLAEMLAVIQNASRIARNEGAVAKPYFKWWQALYAEQAGWARHRAVPALLANLGVSLMERAVLDGLCRAAEMPLHQFLKSGHAEIDPGQVRGELAGLRVTDFLPEAPLQRVMVRHTVGLGDPLRASEIPEAERLDDGLPHALDESIRAHGLRYFKIKVCGRPEVDLPRLREITAVICEGCAQGFHATLDGNEQFSDLGAFVQFYHCLSRDGALRPLFESLILLEQPLHRRHALEDAVGKALPAWSDGPGMIIDESDGALDDLPRALSLGYRGASHKNCKGIMKGLANAALLHRCRQLEPGGVFHLSGEDLANVGPVTLQQDLAMMALLGIAHVERNGHHYFRGLDMYPRAVQRSVLGAHGGLYREHERGYATLDIRDGALDLRSVNDAPFGHAMEFDPSAFEPLNDWVRRGGMSAL
jgi:hypothetical protein